MDAINNEIIMRNMRNNAIIFTMVKENVLIY